MTNNEFKETLDSLLKPYGFKKKGNIWRNETVELEKIIELQKSGYSNLYYLNYGYNFKDLNYNDVRFHIFNRLGSSDSDINKRIQKTLDLEISMEIDDRIKNLTELINDILLRRINSTNNKIDILNQLKDWTTRNGIPLKVKEYLNI